MKIILGTASVQRQEVFREMGYEDFEVVTADIDEKAIRFDDPEKLTLELAKAKAKAIQEKLTEPAILITADQVIVWNGEIREKPESEEQARAYLQSLHKTPSRIVNGIAVTNTATGKQLVLNDISVVVFRQIPEEDIERILATKKVFTWAGGFATEDPLFVPYVESMEGANGGSRGLPKELTERLIKEVQE